jgi:hypothetical protein
MATKMKHKSAGTVPNLFLCILFDIIGYASFSIPVLGESIDIIWAPLSGWLFYKMFGGKFGIFGGAFDFVEEILPFTDFIPTFSIAWCIRFLQQPKKISPHLPRRQ